MSNAGFVSSKIKQECTDACGGYFHGDDKNEVAGKRCLDAAATRNTSDGKTGRTKQSLALSVKASRSLPPDILVETLCVGVRKTTKDVMDVGKTKTTLSIIGGGHCRLLEDSEAGRFNE